MPSPCVPPHDISDYTLAIFVVIEQAGDKPAALKLVLKVGAPYTPSDVTSADSQSETVDSDSDKKSRTSKRKHQSENVEHQEKKVLKFFKAFVCCLYRSSYYCGLRCLLH